MSGLKLIGLSQNRVQKQNSLSFVNDQSSFDNLTGANPYSEAKETRRIGITSR